MILQPLIEFIEGVDEFIIYTFVIIYTSSYNHFKTHLFRLYYWQPIVLLLLTVRNAIKAIVFSVVGIISFLVMLITAFVPIFGKLNLSELIKRTITFLFGKGNIESFRDGLIEVNQKISDKDKEPNTRGLEELRAEAERRFQDGELLFSGIVGAVIILYQTNFAVNNTPVTGTLSIVTMIEIYLIGLALLTTYRVAFIDILAYSDREEERVSRAKIEWQRAITFRPQIQFYVLLGATAKLLSESAFQNALIVLEERYTQDLSLIDTVELAWQQIKQ